MIKRQSGFTLLELTIAMALSSFTILVMSAGVIRLFHIYQSGNEIRNTQQAARSITEDITRQVRGAAGVGAGLNSSPGAAILCAFQPAENVGAGSQFPTTAYWIDGSGASAKLKKASYYIPGTVMPTSCGGSLPSGGSDLTNTNQVVVTGLAVDPLSPTPDSANGVSANLLGFTLKIASASGYDQVNTLTGLCNDGTGARYCSVTALSTSVLARGAN